MGLILLGILKFCSAQKKIVILKRSTKNLAATLNPTNVSPSDKMNDTDHDS